MSVSLPEVPGVLTADEIRVTGDHIAALQLPVAFLVPPCWWVSSCFETYSTRRIHCVRGSRSRSAYRTSPAPAV